MKLQQIVGANAQRHKDKPHKLVGFTGTKSCRNLEPNFQAQKKMERRPSAMWLCEASPRLPTLLHRTSGTICWTSSCSREQFSSTTVPPKGGAIRTAWTCLLAMDVDSPGRSWSRRSVQRRTKRIETTSWTRPRRRLLHVLRGDPWPASRQAAPSEGGGRCRTSQSL